MSDRPSNGGSAGYSGGPSAAGISSEGCIKRLRRQSGHRVHPIWASRRKGAS